MKNVDLEIISVLMALVVMVLPLFIKQTVIGTKYHICLRHYKTIIGLKLYHIHMILWVMTARSALKQHPITIVMPVLLMLWSVYFFIRYIYQVHPSVKKQHYQKELCGIFYASDEVSDSKSDLVTNMSNGSTTEKQLSQQLIDYFNEDHQETFEEIFGPNSFIYDKHPKYKWYWKTHYHHLPYDYTAECGLNHISHEFFMLFKDIKPQKKWSLKVLELFNGDYTRGFSDQKIDNLIRLLSHINDDGKDEALYTSEFLTDLTPYIIEAIRHRPREEMKFYRDVKECYLLNQLFQFIGYTLKKNNEHSFYIAALDLNNRLYNDKGYIGQCNIKKHEAHIREILDRYHNELTVKFVKQF